MNERARMPGRVFSTIVPFMFVYAPSLLLINFHWSEFTIAIISGILGVVALSAAYIGY